MTGLRADLRTNEGWAVEHAVLTVTDLTGRQVARVAADARGTAMTEPLEPGVYTAVITAAGFTPVARTAQVASDGTASLGEITLAPVAGPSSSRPPGRG